MLIDWTWPSVDRLECQEQYKAAIDFMYEEWIQEPENLKVFLRLSFSCWYVIAENEVLSETDVKKEDIPRFEILLNELLAFGKKEFEEDPDFLWLFGYMISLFPENFGGAVDEKTGIAMVKEALAIRPQDPVIQLVLLKGIAHAETLPEYAPLCAVVNAMLPNRFVGEGELQRYFREVF